MLKLNNMRENISEIASEDVNGIENKKYVATFLQDERH